MFDLKRLQSLEQEWEAIEASYRIAPYNAPLNRDEEYRKVVAAYQQEKVYNPQFAYQAPPEYPVARLRKFRAALNRLAASCAGEIAAGTRDYFAVEIFTGNAA